MQAFSSSKFKYPQSYQKTLHQLSVVSKSSICIGRGSPLIPPSGGVKIGASFFRVWGCALGCSACCTSFSLDYLPSERNTTFKDFPELEGLLIEREIKVNNKSYSILSIPQEPGLLPAAVPGTSPLCRFVNRETGACMAHESVPYTCRIEMVKFRKMGSFGYVLKAPYGRAWNLLNSFSGKRGDVKCTFCQATEKEVSHQIMTEDLPALRRLLDWATFFSIPTYLPNILEYLERGNLKPTFFK